MKPFGLISDTHHHNWSSFATTLSSGVNSRLQQILDETLRCATEVGAAGGDTIIHAGDLFHVRGSVAPSVLNPTLELYKKLTEMGFRIYINAGNHDLEGRDANELGSAITALKEVGCIVVNKPIILPKESLALVPYIGNVADLKKTLEKLQDETDAPNCDLIIHAGIDGVIKGLPNHGLDAGYLTGLKFNRIFAGHYHHHKKLADRVWSIGALTHQTWGDIGTKAGFVIVDGSDVNWRSTRAPQFVEVDGTMSEDDIALIVDGNYVRAKTYSGKAADLEKLRSFLIDSGAKGVTIIAQPDTGVTRTASTVKAGASIEVSVSDFIKSADFENKEELDKACQAILAEARMEIA
jgi:DNA repair exonuclease SbcCD nuclease subunit